MKKIALSLLIFFGSISLVNAASVSITTSQATITSGSKVTFYVNINGAAAWQLTGQGTGATTGCSLGDNGTGDSGNGSNTNKRLSVTCQATSIGQISFSVTGNITDEQMKTTNISEHKVIAVSAPREKDANNNLASLSVDGYNISPAFNADTLEYTVDVPSTVNKININASLASKYATLAGTGEKEVNEGANLFEIKATSETGIEKTYKITVNVKDENPITITINNTNYTIIKNAKNLTKPEAFENTTVKINDIEVPAFYNEIAKITLIGIKNSAGQTFLAIYKNNNNYELYNEIKSNQLLLLIHPIPEEKEHYIKTTITIADQKIECLKNNEESNYAIVYATNLITGQDDYYIYDIENVSYIKYSDEQIKPYQDQITKYQQVTTYLLIGLILTLFILVIVILKKSKRKKSLNTPVKVNTSSVNHSKSSKPKTTPKTTPKKPLLEDDSDDEMFDILERSKKKKR